MRTASLAGSSTVAPTSIRDWHDVIELGIFQFALALSTDVAESLEDGLLHGLGWILAPLAQCYAQVLAKGRVRLASISDAPLVSLAEFAEKPRVIADLLQSDQRAAAGRESQLDQLLRVVSVHGLDFEAVLSASKLLLALADVHLGLVDLGRAVHPEVPLAIGPAWSLLALGFLA